MATKCLAQKWADIDSAVRTEATGETTNKDIILYLNPKSYKKTNTVKKV